MANTKGAEKYSIDKKEHKVCGKEECVEKKKQEEDKMPSKVKVQLSKSSCTIVPSQSDSGRDKATTSHATHEENNNNTKLIKREENKSSKVTEESVGEMEHNKTECQECGATKKENSEEQDAATAARLRAQRRWRMGLLKRSKLGGIGQDVTGLFPDYFPSPITTTKDNEEDDILTSLKESKQRHRAKLLKQDSIDKIDRELGDRETKLIAGSWLQIYS